MRLQRGANFHGVWPWVLSGAIMRLPEAALSTSVFSVIVYFSVGFTPTAGRFFTFWVVCFAMQSVSVALFMMAAALTGNDVAAEGLGAVVGIAMIATSGFPIAFSELAVGSPQLPLSAALPGRVHCASQVPSRVTRASAEPGVCSTCPLLRTRAQPILAGGSGGWRGRTRHPGRCGASPSARSPRLMQILPSV